MPPPARCTRMRSNSGRLSAIFLKMRFIIGTPDDCLERLLPLRTELGVDHFIFRTDWIGMPAETARQSIELLDSEVVPVLRSA